MNKTLKGMIACLALAAALLAVPCVAQAGQGKGISIRENFGKDLRRVLKREKYDQNRDGFLSRGEIRKIKSIGVYPDYTVAKIDVRGISRLKNLEELKIEIDSYRGKKAYGLKEIGKLKKLKVFRMSMNLKEKRKIDLRKLKNLSYVNIASSKLTVSVRKGNKIKALLLNGVENGASLVKKCQNAQHIFIGKTSRKVSIRLEKMKKLRSFVMERCSNVEKIKVGKCDKLGILSFDKVNNCKELEVKDCRRLWNIEVYNGTVEKITVRNIPQIYDIQISYVKNLKEVRLSNMKMLNILSISYNSMLEKITLENLPRLVNTDLSHNLLKELNVLGENRIVNMNISYNKLKKFEYNTLKRLSELNIRNNKLEGKFDMSLYPNLRDLDCQNNRLTEIYGGVNEWEMDGIDCSNNKIKLIDFRWTQAGYLMWLNCKNNPGIIVYANVEDGKNDADAKIYWGWRGWPQT